MRYELEGYQGSTWDGTHILGGRTNMYKVPSVTGGLVTAITSSCLNLNLYAGDELRLIICKPQEQSPYVWCIMGA